MYAHPEIRSNDDFCIPDSMKAWVLGDPGQLMLVRKTVPVPGKAEVLVRIDAIAICATDLDNIYRGPPALIGGGLPFNKNWTPSHEYMGTVVALVSITVMSIKVIVPMASRPMEAFANTRSTTSIH
jgi:L-iditol 2-dehydrogenase